ncbi:hypothetical protein [[Mycobacterium] zoologicum]|uniref:hypothetical protein n=1 Tax=[Mycobacterium] zoologicum TaxID=2872311 RepID=UPI002BB65869|nr:hypothetical protein [Mycolicibacter sp. MYC101]MEB3065536.1 hypothetical protein [Mycolicibacter sp. MYC101]
MTAPADWNHLTAQAAARPGENTSDTLRQALRLLDHEQWLAQFRADTEALTEENVNAEPEAW